MAEKGLRTEFTSDVKKNSVSDRKIASFDSES